MKGFTERSPLIIGAIVIAAIVLGTAGSLFMTAGFFANRYAVIAEFSDSAGLKPGDGVRVAGVRVGQVSSVEAAGRQVAAKLLIDDGVELSADTRAEVVVETLLGQKYVKLDTGEDWSSLLEDGAVIENGKTPTEVLDLQNIGTPLLEETDAKAMNATLEHLATITDGKREQVATIIEGLNDLTSQVNQRKVETSRLLESAGTLTSTLAARDAELAAAVDNLNLVVSGLAERRADLVKLLQETRLAAAATADLVGDNRARLDTVLNELEADLEIVGRHQIDLAHTVAYLSVAIEGFSSIGYSAGDFPNEWGNIFTQFLTDPQADQVMGACGPVDQALDLALGPDPLPCEERDGPSTVDPGAGALSSGERAGGGRPTVGSARAPIVTDDELERSMTLFLAPFLQVGS